MSIKKATSSSLSAAKSEDSFTLLPGGNAPDLRPLFAYAAVVDTDGMGATLFDVGKRDGRYVVPGDVIRLDERPEDTVVRATLEVLGLLVESEGLCSVQVDVTDPARPVSLVYRCHERGWLPQRPGHDPGANRPPAGLQPAVVPYGVTIDGLSAVDAIKLWSAIDDWPRVRTYAIDGDELVQEGRSARNPIQVLA
jgi:ADP-ribose pyrophosphatase YjhB (NUDIX family)